MVFSLAVCECLLEEAPYGFSLEDHICLAEPEDKLYFAARGSTIHLAQDSNILTAL